MLPYSPSRVEYQGTLSNTRHQTAIKRIEGKFNDRGIGQDHADVDDREIIKPPKVNDQAITSPMTKSIELDIGANTLRHCYEIVLTTGFGWIDL